MDEDWIETAYQERKAWQREQRKELAEFATALFAENAKVPAPKHERWLRQDVAGIGCEEAPAGFVPSKTQA